MGVGQVMGVVVALIFVVIPVMVSALLKDGNGTHSGPTMDDLRRAAAEKSA